MLNRLRPTPSTTYQAAVSTRVSRSEPRWRMVPPAGAGWVAGRRYADSTTVAASGGTGLSGQDRSVPSPGGVSHGEPPRDPVAYPPGWAPATGIPAVADGCRTVVSAGSRVHTTVPIGSVSTDGSGEPACCGTTAMVSVVAGPAVIAAGASGGGGANTSGSV